MKPTNQLTVVSRQPSRLNSRSGGSSVVSHHSSFVILLFYCSIVLLPAAYCLLLLPIRAIAQQLPQHTQYLLNDYSYNPAVAGIEKYMQVKSNVRFQWVGLPGAPKTYLLSMYGPIGKGIAKSKDAVGLMVYSDVFGSNTRNGAYISYSHHLLLRQKEDNELRLSLALSVGGSQYKINASDLTLNDNADPTIMAININQSAVLPDAKFGTYLYNKKFYLGACVHQLLRRKIDLFETDYYVEEPGRLNLHYYINGGYKFAVGENFGIEPSFLIKQVTNLPFHADFGMLFSYQNMVWLGASYRTEDAVSILAGYTIANSLSFGYSYDFTTSNLKNYSNGTHEFMLVYKFKKSYRPMVE